MSVSCFAGKFYRIAKWITVLFFCAYGLAYADVSANDQSIDVTIVLSEKKGVYEEFGNSLGQILSKSDITHHVIDATQPLPASGMFIGVGIKAATSLAAGKSLNVINVMISKASHEKLLHDHPERSAASMSAIYLNQPYNRQAHMVAAILPGKRNVGILYSNETKELEEVHRVFKEYALKLQEQKVDETKALPGALQELLLGRSDMLFALPDAGIYADSTIRNILLATYHKGIPLIGYSAGYVKAGALCAVVSTPAQIAAQTARMIVKFNETHILPASQYPREFEVMVNRQVADSLGLHVKDGATLHDEIEQGPKDMQ